MPGDDHEDHAAGHDRNRNRLHRNVEDVARADECAAGPDGEHQRHGGKGHQHAQKPDIQLQRIDHAAPGCDVLGRKP